MLKRRILFSMQMILKKLEMPLITLKLSHSTGSRFSFNCSQVSPMPSQWRYSRCVLQYNWKKNLNLLLTYLFISKKMWVSHYHLHWPPKMLSSWITPFTHSQTNSTLLFRSFLTNNRSYSRKTKQKTICITKWKMIPGFKKMNLNWNKMSNIHESAVYSWKHV